MLRRSFLLSIPTGAAMALWGQWLQAKQEPLKLGSEKALGPFMYASFAAYIDINNHPNYFSDSILDEDQMAGGWGNRFYGDTIEERARGIRDKLLAYLRPYFEHPDEFVYLRQPQLRIWVKPGAVSGHSGIIKWSSCLLPQFIASVNVWLVQDIIQVSAKAGTELKVSGSGTGLEITQEYQDGSPQLFSSQHRSCACTVRHTAKRQSIAGIDLCTTSGAPLP